MKARQFYPTTSELPLLLDGRMTAIVRPTKETPGDGCSDKQFLEFCNDLMTSISPFGTAKDILWCKEPFNYLSDNALHNTPEMEYMVNYRWDNEFKDPKELYWRSSVTMPKSACRLWLQVLEVKVITSQDITREMGTALGMIGDDFAHDKSFEWCLAHQYPNCNWFWYATVKRIEKP